jgi:hypothetical protein
MGRWSFSSLDNLPVTVKNREKYAPVCINLKIFFSWRTSDPAFHGSAG